MAVVVPVLVLGLTWLLLTPAQYVSTTQLLVSINGSTTATAYQNDDVVTGRVNSYIALLTSDVVSKRVVDKLHLPMTPREFAAKVSATNVPPKTSIIDVAVTDTSPAQARLLADTVADEFINYAAALETPTGEDDQKVRTTVVSTASAPRSRLAERVALGLLTALAAVLVGAVAVWIRSRYTSTHDGSVSQDADADLIEDDAAGDHGDDDVADKSADGDSPPCVSEDSAK